MAKTKKERLKILLGDNSEKLISLDDFRKGAGSYIEDFKQVYDNVKAIDDRQEDIITPINNLKVDIKNIDNIALTIKDTDESFLFSEWSLKQLCNRYHIPSAYIKHCISKGHNYLASKNINSWLDSEFENDDLLLRFDKQEKRLHGILSSRYSIFDDIEVFDIINDVFKKDGYRVESYAVNPEFMNIRIIQEEKFDDDLSIGFNIRNSRVGRSSLYVEVLVYKWACSNGLLMGGGSATAYKKKHVGFDGQEVGGEVKDIVAKLPKMLEYFKEQIEKNKNIKIDSDKLEGLFNKFMLAQQVSSANIDKARTLIDSGVYDKTAWGYINAVTEIAQEYDLVKRLKIERYAGKLLNSKIA